MGPKPKTKHVATKPGEKKSAFSNLDDFIDSGADAGTSVIQAGTTIQEKQRQTLREKYDEGKAPEALAINNMKLSQCRTLCLVFSGMVTGILALPTMYGLIFLVLSQLFVGLLYAMVLGFKAEPYFMSVAQIVTGGVFTNGLTFALVWIAFYNIVHVL